MPKTPFARFFSCVPGHVVSRYGSGSAKYKASQIGAARPTDGAPYAWDELAITAITEKEVATYAREYNAAVAEGALLERTEDDYLAFVASHDRSAITPDAAVTES